MVFEPILHPETERLHWVVSPKSWADPALCGETLPIPIDPDPDENAELDISDELTQWNTDVDWGQSASNWCVPCAQRLTALLMAQ